METLRNVCITSDGSAANTQITVGGVPMQGVTDLALKVGAGGLVEVQMNVVAPGMFVSVDSAQGYDMTDRYIEVLRRLGIKQDMVHTKAQIEYIFLGRIDLPSPTEGPNHAFTE